METLCLIVRKDDKKQMVIVEYDLYPSSVAVARANAHQLLYPALQYGTLPIDDSAAEWCKPQAVSP